MRFFDGPGPDGVTDVPDDTHPSTAHCTVCDRTFRPEDDADCGREECPVKANEATLRELLRP